MAVPVGAFPAWLQTNLPAAGAVAGAPTVSSAAGVAGAGAGITGSTSAGAAIAAAPGGVATVGLGAFVGGFAIGEAVVRPILGIEYPGGGGLGDYLNRRQQDRINQAGSDAGGTPSDSYPGAGGLTGGQNPGVRYFVTGFGTRIPPGQPPQQEQINNIGVGPFSQRRTTGPGTQQLLLIDGNGSTIFSIAGSPETEMFLSPIFTRQDGQDDSYGSPLVGASPPSPLQNPPTLDPASTPRDSPNREPRRDSPMAPPIPVPTSPPNAEPVIPPNRSPDPAPGDTARPGIPGGIPALGIGLGSLGIGLGLGGVLLGGASLQNPLTAGAGSAIPPTRPPQAPPTGRCGCNAGILSGMRGLLGQQTAALTANGAGSAAILTKLDQMQNFAESAWKNTHLDKAINALTLLGVLHNAYYVSTDLAFTFGEFVSLGLSAVGIKDEEGNALDINSLVKDRVQGIINSLIGQENAQAISQRLSRFGRIFRAGSNIVWTLRNIQDTTADVLELTANNTGKIGNALKRSGVVDRLSYPWMSTNVQASDLWRRKFQRVFDGLEQAEDTLGAAYGVTANVLELGEEMNFLSQQKQHFIDEVTQGADAPGLENQPIRDQADLENQQSTSPELEGVRLGNANTITP